MMQCDVAAQQRNQSSKIHMHQNEVSFEYFRVESKVSQELFHSHSWPSWDERYEGGDHEVKAGTFSEMSQNY